MLDRLVCALVYALMFSIGWISGGGMLTFITMFLLERLGMTPTNDWFVAGCLWGTFGVYMGNFMGNFMKQEARNVQ